MRNPPYPAGPLPPCKDDNKLRLSNDELRKAIGTTLSSLELHHVKFNNVIKTSTENHYIYLIAEELRRAKIE